MDVSFKKQAPRRVLERSFNTVSTPHGVLDGVGVIFPEVVCCSVISSFAAHPSFTLDLKFIRGDIGLEQKDGEDPAESSRTDEGRNTEDFQLTIILLGEFLISEIVYLLFLSLLYPSSL